jgi:hypothetical protein
MFLSMSERVTVRGKTARSAPANLLDERIDPYQSLGQTRQPGRPQADIRRVPILGILREWEMWAARQGRIRAVETKEEKFLQRFVEFGPAVRLYREGRASGPPEHQRTENRYRKQGEIMPQFLVANYMPDNFDPSTVTEAMMEEIHALNREMIAAGVRKFACGISPAGSAKTLRAQPGGKVLVTDGPYTETKEHMGGFWILECADMNEALAWAKRGAIACDVVGEVRELLFFPAPEQATK